jgi:hydroxymethylglutaryl-CoA synthase
MTVFGDKKTVIVGYGSYIPRYRIKIESIAHAWGESLDTLRGLRVQEISVKGPDEDQVTIAVEAARNALRT